MQYQCVRPGVLADIDCWFTACEGVMCPSHSSRIKEGIVFCFPFPVEEVATGCRPCLVCVSECIPSLCANQLPTATHSVNLSFSPISICPTSSIVYLSIHSFTLQNRCLPPPPLPLSLFSLDNSSGVIVDHLGGGDYRAQNRCLFYLESDRYTPSFPSPPLHTH